MRHEARQAMIDIGVKDPSFGRLMMQIWQTYERSQRNDISRGGVPGFQEETGAMRRIVGGIVRRSKQF